jgi:hypothetical protein
MDDARAPLPCGHSIDVDAAIAQAVSHRRSYDLVRHTEQAAVAYAAATMTEAIRSLCALATDAGTAGVVAPSGARLVACAHAEPTTRDFLLTHDDAPGAFLVSVLYKPDLTPEAKAQVAALDARLAAEAAAKGLSPREHLFQRLQRALGTDSPEGKERAALENGPDSRVPVGPDTRIASITAVPIWLAKPLSGARAGAPAPFAKDSCVDLHRSVGVPFKDRPESYKLVLELSAPKDDGDRLRPAYRTGGCLPGSVLEPLSDLIAAHGLIHLVHADDARVRHCPWDTTGVGPFPDFERVGYGAMAASQGLFDAQVSACLRRLSQAVWAQIAADHVQEWTRVASTLARLGHTGADTELSCNDGRDLIWVHTTAKGWALRLVTQHASMEIRMRHATHAAPARALFKTVRGAVFARFVFPASGGCIPDFVASDAGPDIVPTARTIGLINGVFLSLSSVHDILDDAGQHTP